METTYGIAVRNRFDLCFDDDVEDPLEILKQQEAELQKKRSEKIAKEKNKPAKPLPSLATKEKKPAANSISAKASGDSKSQEKIGKPSRALTEKTVNEHQNKSVEFSSFAESRPDAEPQRGRGGFRNTRGGLNRGRPGMRGKREFDRQSGSTKSTVKPVEKREGRGPHNWGAATDDVQVPDDSFVEENVGEVVSPESELKENDAPVVEAKEQEEPAMTLDEWKKKEEGKRSVPSYNLRKPGEGEEKKWEKGYVLKKKEQGKEDDEEEYEDDDNIKRGRQKQHLDIEIKFGDMALRGGRGKGRGGFGRGRGGRGEGRAAAAGQASQRPAPKVDDFNDFPSLSNA